jgi:hypothetical protein
MFHFFGIVGLVVVLLALGAALRGLDNPRGARMGADVPLGAHDRGNRACTRDLPAW